MLLIACCKYFRAHASVDVQIIVVAGNLFYKTFQQLWHELCNSLSCEHQPQLNKDAGDQTRKDVTRKKE